MKKSDILMIVGCILFLLSVLLGVLAIRSIRTIYVDSAIIVEIHPIGGMSPRLYAILLVLLFFSGFLCLALATLLAPKEAVQKFSARNDG